MTEPGEIAGAIEKAQRHNAGGRAVLPDIHTNLEARRSQVPWPSRRSTLAAFAAPQRQRDLVAPWTRPRDAIEP